MTNSETADLQEIMEEKKRIEIGGQFRWFHWLILSASFILTLAAWYIAKSQNDEQIKAQFERESSQAIDLVSERMKKYEDTLASAVAFLGTQGDYTDIHTWKAYSDALDIENKYPGINGIGIIHNIKPEQLQDYLSHMRRNRPDFNIHPPHGENEFFPITNIEPVETNSEAVGLDIAHEANRYNAARKSRDTGQPQITGPIILVQDAKKTPGFLFYIPLYEDPQPFTTIQRRETLTALVYAPFIFSKLMDGTLDNENRHVGLKITDGEHILFNENYDGAPDYDNNPLFSSTHSIYMYGRQWAFNIRSTESFRTANANILPQIILFTGIIINILIFGIFLLLARSNRRAVTFASNLANAHEDKAARLSDVIDNAVDGLMTVSATGEIKTFNKACADMFGYKSDLIIGNKIAKLIPGLTFHDLSATNHTKEVKAKRLSGREFPAELSANTLNIHGREIYSIIIRDISKRKQDESVIRKAMSELEQSNADLEKFAYVASHDLKSPLRAIDNLSLWLEEDIGDQLDPENKDRLNMLRGRVVRMENLLDDLLNYSRATEGDHQAEPVSAASLVQTLNETLHLPSGFTLNAAQEMSTITVSKMPLQHVLHNIISNSIKHHDKSSGRIDVSVTEKGNRFEFTVKDDGPGIPPAFHEQIFTMFQTLKPRDEVEGSGMGLAIVKKIVNRYGGTIRVVSELGHGASFIFTWPKIGFEALNEGSVMPQRLESLFR
ncbi:MAG: CHASE domain-containing protein [Alphaproteobacteria bacterium]